MEVVCANEKIFDEIDWWRMFGCFVKKKRTERVRKLPTCRKNKTCLKFSFFEMSTNRRLPLKVFRGRVEI